ncbi:thermonuclease family protein [Candidatus Scalindua japonica]|uniref:thermonuclease family protein n=1 Tax=Candidatus Scalindua japonica TaxID=1284222 RepID=UPI0013A58E17|nr:thermonuclease family protein [Candidatus Scalindua japonica]
MKKQIKTLSLVFVLVLVYSPIYAQQKTLVTRIIDGDIVQVLYEGLEKRIRLIGIDAPESRIDRKALKEANMSEHDIETIVEMGAKAKAYVNGLIKRGDFVTIEFDIKEMDRYGRLLCYVYLSNGKMLNEEIVRAGYANVKTIPPNIKYEDTFLNAFKYAEETKGGLWDGQ